MQSHHFQISLFMLSYEIFAFVLMKTAASFSSLKTYRIGAKSVLKFIFTKSVINGGGGGKN
jgi:hypothetical protein